MMDEINKEKSQNGAFDIENKNFSMTNVLFFTHFETVEPHSKAQTKHNHLPTMFVVLPIIVG